MLYLLGEKVCIWGLAGVLSPQIIKMFSPQIANAQSVTFAEVRKSNKSLKSESLRICGTDLGSAHLCWTMTNYGHKNILSYEGRVTRSPCGWSRRSLKRRCTPARRTSGTTQRWRAILSCSTTPLRRGTPTGATLPSSGAASSQAGCMTAYYAQLNHSFK